MAAVDPAQPESSREVDVLGMTLADITPELREKYELDAAESGLVVTDVAPDSNAAEKGIRLDLDWSDDVPDRIQSDPIRLRQILINLLGNAVRFTGSGGVRVQGRMSGEQLEVEVVDSGAGMDPERLERLFEPCPQGDPSTPRRLGGTGLGLPISRRLARLLGGNLVVDSVEGQGTTFALHVAPDLERSARPAWSPASTAT